MRRLILAMLLLVGTAAHADEAGVARRSLEAFSTGLKSLQATFSQRVISPEGRVESEGSGEVWMQHPGLFRWTYGGEYPELIVADGERVWMYDEMLDQVTVKAQSAQAEDSPLVLLTDPEAIKRQFTVTELGDFEDMNILSLVSNNPESEFERVLLGFADQRLVLMALEDAFGLRTEIRFADLVRNVELDPALFRFEPPAGADVVGEVSGEAGS